MKQFMAYVFLATILVAVGCNDGSIIGNDLLENEGLDLKYDDNFMLKGRTVRGDTVATYRRGAVNQTYLLGNLDDPIFGKLNSDIYTGIQYGSATPPFDSEVDIIDSIVLELEYDTLGFYGDTLANHLIEVFRVTEDWILEDTLYSDRSFASEMIPLGSKFVRPAPNDDVRFQVRLMDQDSFVFLSPRLNIRLDDAFGQELIQDTLAAQSDSSLIALVKGLYIKSTPSASSMIGFNFSENRPASAIIGKLAVYYTAKNDEGEDQKRTYNYSLRSETFSEFILDYEGTPVKQAFNDFDLGDEFLYSQGVAGSNVEVDLPDLSALKGQLINSAQLVMTVAEGAEFETDLYPTIGQFLMSKYDEDGESRVLIDDIVKEGISVSTGLGILDGEPKTETLDNGEIVKTITFNITDFVKNSIDEEDKSPRVIISPVGRSENPRRTVFYGPNHPTYPAKLRIAYTII